MSKKRCQVVIYYRSEDELAIHAFSRSGRKLKFFDSFHGALHEGKAEGLSQPNSDRKMKISVWCDLNKPEHALTYQEHVAFGLSQNSRELLRMMAVKEGNRLLEGCSIAVRGSAVKKKNTPKTPPPKSKTKDKPRSRKETPGAASFSSASPHTSVTTLELIAAELKGNVDEKTTQKLLLMAQDLLEHPDSPEEWQNDWKHMMLFIRGAVQKSATLNVLTQERGLATDKKKLVPSDMKEKGNKTNMISGLFERDD